MQINFYEGNLLGRHGEPRRTEASLILSPSIPFIQLTEKDLLERRATELLHVKVTNEEGRVSHIHFALSTTDNGRIKAEVSTTVSQQGDEHKTSAKSVVANWRDPVIPEATGGTSPPSP
jgi:hypothetical protein